MRAPSSVADNGPKHAITLMIFQLLTEMPSFLECMAASDWSSRLAMTDNR